MPGSASKKKSEIVLDIDDDSLSSDFEDTEVVASETESKAKPLKRNQTASKKTIASSTEKELLSQESQGDISNVETDSFDVILPPLLGSGNSGECTVMIEVDPEDAALFDYEGISGAIGRFEADERGGK